MTEKRVLIVDSFEIGTTPAWLERNTGLKIKQLKDTREAYEYVRDNTNGQPAFHVALIAEDSSYEGRGATHFARKIYEICPDSSIIFLCKRQEPCKTEDCVTRTPFICIRRPLMKNHLIKILQELDSLEEKCREARMAESKNYRRHAYAEKPIVSYQTPA